jgi:beta-mannanase
MWEQAFVPGVGNLITSRGAIPFMDMSSKSVPLTDITNGVYDSSIITWADSVKTWGKPLFFRWNWEMNGPWFSWGAQAQQNPSNFVAAWKHFHDVVASRGANNVTWVWCPNTVYTGSTPLNQLYPGDSYVDWTCIDGYNKASVGSSYYNAWQSFSQVFQNTYNQVLAIAPSKPIMIGETGSNEGGGSKAAWLADALQTQLPVNYPKVKAFVWFNWPIYEGGAYQQWPIESSASSQDAFKTGIQSPYYAGNNYGNLPALTKVQPIQ